MAGTPVQPKNHNCNAFNKCWRIGAYRNFVFHCLPSESLDKFARMSRTRVAFPIMIRGHLTPCWNLNQCQALHPCTLFYHQSRWGLMGNPRFPSTCQYPCTVRRQQERTALRSSHAADPDLRNGQHGEVGKMRPAFCQCRPALAVPEMGICRASDRETGVSAAADPCSISIYQPQFNGHSNNRGTEQLPYCMCCWHSTI